MAASPTTVFQRLSSSRVLTVFTNDVERAVLEVSFAAEELDPIPTLVLLDWQKAPTLSRELGEIETALADALLSLFPNWHRTAHGKFECHRFPRAELELHLVEARRASPRVSANWFRKAYGRCQKGKPPIFKDMASAPQVKQLTLALDPIRPIFCLSVHSEKASVAKVRGLARASEWLARETGAGVLLIVPEGWSNHSELDPVNYGAAWLDFEAESTVRRAESLQPESGPAHRPMTGAWASPQPSSNDTLTDSGATPRTSRTARAPNVIVQPNPGKPHALSDAEQRLARFLTADPELEPLFEFNQLLHGFCVDLLWRGGRLVVEVDGADHRREEKYFNDRDRDYRLFMSGYATLRICNGEIFSDVERVLSKIRNVVRVRTSSEGVSL